MNKERMKNKQTHVYNVTDKVDKKNVENIGNYKTTKRLNSEVISKILEVKDSMGLTPRNLVEEAREKDSVLHDFFDWNNTQAGEKWRIHQATVLINQVEIEVGEEKMFAFESVSVQVEDGRNERVYMTPQEIVSNSDFKKQVIKNALSIISTWQDKYKQYTELSPIFTSIKKVRKKLRL